MITKDMVREGIAKGLIQFIIDPIHEHGTVCTIGDHSVYTIGAHWFYFGNEIAESENPQNFMRNADWDKVVDDIYNTLESFRIHPSFGVEYRYYDTFLHEMGVRDFSDCSE